MSQSQNSQQFHIRITAAKATQKVPQILADASGLSQQSVKTAMQKGAVWLEAGNNTRRIRRASVALIQGYTLHFYYAPHVLDIEPPVPKLVADEQDYSVWYKPSGLLCQGSKWSDHCTINRWIESHQPFVNNPQRNCFIVHRLDKAARGLVLIAHTKRAAQQLAALFEQRNIEKYYRVIVEGRFPAEEHTITSPIEGKPSCSVVNRLAFDGYQQYSLLNVEIKTGRKHQIRRHLSEHGYPVVGDRLYGKAQQDSIDLQLQAFCIAFICPLSQVSRSYCCPDALVLGLPLSR